MNIKITGEEKYKSEIVYNNLVDSMKEMKLSKDEQIEYLKSKLEAVETETHLKMVYICTILAGIIGVGFGLYFVAIDQYLFGTILAFGTLALMIYKLYLIIQTQNVVSKDENYDKIENLRKMLDMRLK